ncbi:MAG: hypothetical protein HY960_06500 [Ignavibacteriae bacterium]|nr:hypothetical protein [Ignavibacteriota bacterium]
MKTFFTLITFILFFGILNAQVPKKITYQGTLAYLNTQGKMKPVKATTATTSYNVRFNFYDASTSGTLMYQYPSPSTGKSVKTDKNGLYTIILGENGTALGDFDLSQFTIPLWVQVTILSGPETKISYPYTVPGRVQLTTVPYAAVASDLSSTANVSITSLYATQGIKASNEDPNGDGLLGESQSAAGVVGHGLSVNATGVFGYADNEGVGVVGYSWDNIGVNGFSHDSYAGYFFGDVFITGTLNGHTPLLIDHPLDPANQTLTHSFVESSEMMNVYNGNVLLDASGSAIVTMPDWFELLNTDFRYQLTSLGAPGPNLYIAEEITKNTFKIAGGTPGGKVSWQVTGVRNDPYARAHPAQVEQIKNDRERGKYYSPELYNQPEEKKIEAIPHSIKTMIEQEERFRISQSTYKQSDKH